MSGSGDDRNNILIGYDWNDDWFEGRGGNDTLDGKGGTDKALYLLPANGNGTLVYEAVGQFVYVRLVEGDSTTDVFRIWQSGAVVRIEDLRPGRPLGIDTLKNIEKIEITLFDHTGEFEQLDLHLAPLPRLYAIHGSIFGDYIDVAKLKPGGAAGQPIYGGLGNDVMIGSNQQGFLYGEDGNDRIVGGSANDVIEGGAGNDTIDGGRGNDTAYFTLPLGMDTRRIEIIGAANAAVVSAIDTKTGAATDMFRIVRNISTGELIVRDVRPDPELGTDRMIDVEVLNFTGTWWPIFETFRTEFTRYRDIVVATGFSDTFVMRAHERDASAGQGDDVVRGNGFANLIYGGGGDDQVFGLGGDDRLLGQEGLDHLDGGAGFDVADYVPGSAPVTIHLAAGTALDRSTKIVDTLRGIEAVQGSFGNDIFDARGFSASSVNGGGVGDLNEFQGLGGDDRIFGNGNTRISYEDAELGVKVDMAAGTATDRFAAYYNGIGLDTFTRVNAVRGSGFNDWLLGSDNPAGTVETFVGLAGGDLIDGRGGIDRVRYDDVGYYGMRLAGDMPGVEIDLAAGLVAPRDDLAWRIFGYDTLLGIEQVVGSLGADIFTAVGFGGSSAANVGDGPANLFEGSGGNDTITGNGHTSISYAGATAGVTVDLLARYAQGDASVGRDSIGAGVVGIVGSAHADILTGNAAANTIEGCLGADLIRGDRGADRLSGGAGKDTFLFAARADSTAAARDVILDFETGDTLRFAIAEYGGPIGYLGTGAFTRGGAFEARLAVSGSSKIVQIDGNGDGRVDMEIDVSGMTGAFRAANFVNDFMV